MRLQVGSGAILVIALLSLTASPLYADAGAVFASMQDPQLQIGEYLRSDYIDLLKSTRSPRQARKSEELQLARVKATPKGLVIQTIVGFHEGGPEFIEGNAGTWVTHVDAGYTTDNLSVRVIDNKAFRLGFDQFPSQQYVFVGQANRYVASVVLEGRYRDAKGQRFVFGRNGRAVLPDGDLSYRVGLYYPPLFTLDYLYLGKTPKVFRVRGSKLEIFNVDGIDVFEEGVVSKTPSWVLTKEE